MARPLRPSGCRRIDTPHWLGTIQRTAGRAERASGGRTDRRPGTAMQATAWAAGGRAADWILDYRRAMHRWDTAQSLRLDGRAPSETRPAARERSGYARTRKSRRDSTLESSGCKSPPVVRFVRSGRAGTRRAPALSRPLRTLAGGVKRRSAIAVDTASSNSELLLNSETCVRTQPRVEERTSHARSERGLLSRRASRCNSEGRSGSRTVCSRQPANQGRIRY